MTRQGLFLDRDGTLVYPRHYPSRPEELLLYPQLGAGLRRLQHAGFELVVITNQGGLAHGYFDEPALDRMHDHLRAELRALGVELAGIFHCPHHPEGSIPALSVRCACRKPQPGMLLEAARVLSLDLQRSWFLGDILDDVEAGNRAGCRTVLVDVGTESRPGETLRVPTYVARDTVHALDIVAAAEGLGAATDFGYRPASWSDEAVAHTRTEQGRDAVGNR